MARLALLTVLATLASPALGHLYITYPKPNDFDKQSAIYKDPLTHTSEGGHNNPFPCKGFLDGPVAAEWQAGSDQKTTVFGSAVHGGGSCQVSLSYDKGKTWTVMKTWLGACPIWHKGNLDADANMDLGFKVPADAPPGEALFGWSWFNRVGNREMYMNCAVVKITGQGTGTGEWAQLPAIFEANNGKGSCSTEANKDLDIPNPGPQVEKSDKAQLAPPTGDCPAPKKAAPPPATEKPKPQQQDKSQGAPAQQGKQPAQQGAEAQQGKPAVPQPPAADQKPSAADQKPPASSQAPATGGGNTKFIPGLTNAAGSQQPSSGGNTDGGNTDCSGHNGAGQTGASTTPAQAAPPSQAPSNKPYAAATSHADKSAAAAPPAGPGDEWECADGPEDIGAAVTPGAGPATTPAGPATPPAKQAASKAGGDNCDVQSGQWCESKWGWKPQRRRSVVFKREI